MTVILLNCSCMKNTVSLLLKPRSSVYFSNCIIGDSFETHVCRWAHHMTHRHHSHTRRTRYYHQMIIDRFQQEKSPTQVPVHALTVVAHTHAHHRLARQSTQAAHPVGCLAMNFATRKAMRFHSALVLVPAARTPRTQPPVLQEPPNLQNSGRLCMSGRHLATLLIGRQARI